MNDFKNATRLSELRKEAVQCSKGLTYKASVSGYLLDNMCKSHRLRKEILAGKYRISKYMIFMITEPKLRRICATRFRDRVWQKSMCNNGLRAQLLKSLIYDNGACQKDKGVDFAIDRMICFLQRYFREHGTNEGFCDHLDIKGYFPNTPHSESKRIIREKVKDERIREHVFTIIDSFKDIRPEEEIKADPFGERGTALGSEISQLMQLAIPSHIDHAVKERFRMKYYIRFNDDMWIISPDRTELKIVREYIISEYAKMGLEVVLKQKNTKLSQGVKFLKRRVILTDTGKVIVKADPKKFGKERRTLRKLKAKKDAGGTTMNKIREHYQSVRAGLMRCDDEVKVKNLDKFYEDLFGESPPESKKKKKGTEKNAYCKSKRSNRERRGKKRSDGRGTQKAAGND